MKTLMINLQVKVNDNYSYKDLEKALEKVIKELDGKVVRSNIDTLEE